MKLKHLLSLILFFLFAGIMVYPQHKSHYVSEVNNEIKALSNDEITELLNGSGMGLAKAAELNQYPGPKHVMDLSSELSLTEEQKEKTESIYESMKTEAVKLGKSLIENEKELDNMFKNNMADEKSVQNKITEISRIRGDLRFVHLNAHLKQKDILTPKQISAYNKLRGY